MTLSTPTWQDGPMSNLSSDQFAKAPKDYTLITQHGEDRKVKRTRFATYEEAVSHAEVHTPDSDRSMVPNVDEKHQHGKTYERGFWWHGNKYAVLHQKRPKGYQE